MIVLDTNVISELMKTAPDARVEQWLQTFLPEELATTSLSIAETCYGLDRLPAGRRRTGLELRFKALIARAFGSRVLSFDPAAAEIYGMLANDIERSGRQLGDSFDAMIAAIALRDNCSIATRNTKHFEGLGIEVHNPWQA